MRKPRVPSYRLHKASGQAVVTLRGRDHYLGKHDTTQSRAAYNAIVAEWLAGGGVGDGGALSVRSLCGHFEVHAATHYRKHGTPTASFRAFQRIGEQLAERHGREPANQFTPLKLVALRKTWIDAGNAQGTINLNQSRVVEIFRWGVENGLVDGTVHHALKAVRAIRHGKQGVKPPRKVRPVPLDVLRKTIAVAKPMLADMIRLQYATGMRSGELTALRICDIDRSGPVWIYTPRFHKTDHLDIDRKIALDAGCQAIIRDYERFPHDQPIFLSPAERTRAIPFTYASNHQRTKSYASAIMRACLRAFPHPTIGGGIGGDADPAKRRALYDHLRKVGWHPHQLRHTAATEIRASLGIEDARLALGHSSTQMTERYAEPDWQGILTRSASGRSEAVDSSLGPRTPRR